MLLMGLTGGIGSGKSTVADQLARHGVHVLDADRMAREVVAPGTDGLAVLRARFGARVMAADGSLDRAALAALVFDDPAARADLQAITHPRIQELTVRRLAELPEDAVAAHDVPLLVELGYAPRYHLVVVVGAPEEVRVQRLVRYRQMAEEDARSRVRAQAGDRDRRAVADAWIDNAGTEGDLREAVDALVRNRVRPLHRNLVAGRAAQPGETVPAGPGEDPGTRPSRVAGRLRYAVGAGSGTVTACAAAEPGWTDAVLSLRRERLGPSRAALERAGFPATSGAGHGSCDPGRPVRVRLRVR